MGSFAGWLRENRQVYFQNAASLRDFRVQLRGNRSVLVFGLYLFILISLALYIYNNVAAKPSISLVEAQAQLSSLYSTIILFLAGVVSLVAPALSATSVVIERQRQSLDLVFSAPVTPKYYLVGKMVSSFRYTWMILALSLPVTATCVVLGGASWADVLVLYLTLSMHGLIFTSIALVLSTLAAKPVSAIVWSYGAVGFYLMLSGLLSAASLGSAFGSRSQEAPFFSAINPFLLQFTLNLHTTVAGVQIPVWTFMLVIAPAITKLCLLGAGSVISPLPGREVTSLRIHLILYLGLIALNLGFVLPSSANSGAIVFSLVSPLFLFMPFLSTFGIDSERRYRPNGWFDAKKTFSGTPAGGLPYILLMIILVWAVYAIGRQSALGPINLWAPGFGAYLMFTVGFWVFFWSVGRVISATFVGLKSARALQFVAMLSLIGLPLPMFGQFAVAPVWDPNTTAWDLYFMRPAFSDQPTLAAIYGGTLLICGILLNLHCERNIRKKLSPERLADERTLASS